VRPASEVPLWRACPEAARRWTRTLGRTIAITAILVTLAACVDAPSASPVPTATAVPEPTAVSKTYELGTKVWYEGLVVTFDRVTSLLDPRGGTVELLVGIANPGADPATLDGGIALVVGDTHVQPTRDSQLPEVPAAGSAATVLTFELQAITSVDAGVFEVGGAPEHVARVPITAQGGQAVTFEPRAFKLKGSAQASTMRLTIRSGLVRWDLPDWAQELNANLAVLTVTYDVTYAGDFGGGLAFTGDNVALKLPDGTVVEARKDGHSQSVELVGSHKTKKGLFSRFEIPSDATGTFTLLVRTPGTQKTIKFAIGG
jgi:hypothetical protein